MQNIGTPRIYINMPQYYIATGSKVGIYESTETLRTYPNDIWISGAAANYLTESEMYSSVGLNMGAQITFPHGQNENNPARWYSVFMPSYAFGGTGLWCGVFGHNFSSIGMYKAYIGLRDAEGESLSQVQGACHQANPFTAGGEFTEYDGWSIKAGDVGNIPTSNLGSDAKFFHITLSNHTGGSEEAGFEGTTFTGDPKFNTWNIGTYYDFPHSPELNAKQSIEMGQLTRHQSVIGGSLSNSMQTKEMWGDLGAWELDSPSEQDDASKLGVRAGKRVWDLSFKHLQDRDTLPINALGSAVANNETMDGYEEGTDWWNSSSVGGIFGAQYNPLNVLNGEDFFSSVWNKTLGGHLPFIFQPDNTNNNPDQFAICKFDQDSLVLNQVANNVYDVKLKIREV